MLVSFKQGEYVTSESYELAFDDGDGNGYGFPCNKDGVIESFKCDAAKENYEWALAHPEKFVRYNKVVKYEFRYRENNQGICECGQQLQLINAYLGACDCPKCGRWYNVFGQELNHPSTWDKGNDW